MSARIPCTPFGKKMKIAMVEQDIPQQELARRLGIANSTISDIIYGRNQCEKTKERIAESLETLFYYRNHRFMIENIRAI